MDQVTTGQRLSQPADADSREGLVIDQRQGNQAPAPTELLTLQHLGQSVATSFGDSDSQRNIGESSEKARRAQKRINDREYRARKNAKKAALEKENDQLKQENREKDIQMQRMKSKLDEVKAECEILKGKSEEKERLLNSLLHGIVQTRSTTDMQQLLAQIKLDISSLNRTVAELQQNITQPPGTQVPVQPCQPQHGMINQGSHAQPAVTTLPLTQLAGTSTMQQTFQSTGTFPEDSNGLADVWLSEKLAQNAYTIGVPPLHQIPGGNTAVESQPLTQGLSPFGHMEDLALEDLDFAFWPCCLLQVDEDLAEIACSIEQSSLEEMLLMHEIEEEEKLMKPNVEAIEAKNGKLKLALEVLEAENTRLKREIEQELFQEEQQMKSNIEAFEAESTRLKREIEEKEQLMKSYLEEFEVENGILMREIEKKEQIMKYNLEAYEAENGRLKHEIEEKERLVKSNGEAIEAKNGKLKLEIGEKEHPMKSKLESFEAENERLKRGIEEKKRLMKFNLKAFEGQNGRLKHEIQSTEQLVKSNLETLEAQIRQLIDEFQSLNVANVAANLTPRMQTNRGELAKSREQKTKKEMQNILN